MEQNRLISLAHFQFAFGPAHIMRKNQRCSPVNPAPKLGVRGACFSDNAAADNYGLSGGWLS